MVMRRVRGTVIMPAAAPSTTALMIVEVRDTSLADSPAPVVASLRLPATAVAPHEHRTFDLAAPEVPTRNRLSLRCHVSLAGDGVVAAGDLLSTQSIPVAAAGDVDHLTVPLTVV
jgi:uncharacterized lipoprotein YbaY